jgi:hypothetical protein
MTTPELFDLLAKKYPAPEYAFLGNVRNTTGYTKQIRTADALALGLWPSRGMYLDGFELKVSRSDWLHELKQPEKAEEICQYCDRWWLVVSDEEIVKDDLPMNWGLMAVVKGKLKILKEAPMLTAIPMDRPFLAGFLRNTQENYIHKGSIAKRLDDARKKGEEAARHHKEYLQRDYDELLKRIDTFEKESGVKIDSWSYHSIGEAVRMVLAGEHLTVREDLTRIRIKIDEALTPKK